MTFDKNLTRRDALKFTTKATSMGLVGISAPALLTNAAEAKTYKNISYGGNRLDIYQPTNISSPHGAPIMIFVHGGAWKAGSKRSVGAKAKHFTSKGYVFISVGYTLYPRANAERQALEVAQAVNWVQLNARQLKGDANRIALMGHSAGCHLSSLASLSGATTAVKALICNDTGAYDLPYLANLNGGSLPFIFSALNKRRNWRTWSPINYVKNKTQPPSLVIWSGGTMRPKIGNNFANALEASQNPVTRFDGSSYNHLSINSAIGKSGRSVTRAVDRFLEQNLQA
ncbi:MAG: alpha/beta hydrolase [Nitratireductor sp.]